jgi:hypothetical protein
MTVSLRCLTLAGAVATLMAAAPTPTPAQTPSAPVATLQPTLATATLGTSVCAPKPRNIGPAVGPGFTSAPVPDADAVIPFIRDPRADQAQLGPSVFAPPQSTYRGEGYVPGSTVDGEQTRKLKPAPGINLTVPLN